MTRPKDSNKRILTINHCPVDLIQRLKMEAVRRKLTGGELVIEMLDKHLPQFSDILAEEPAPEPEPQNGKQTLNNGIQIQSSLLTR